MVVIARLKAKAGEEAEMERLLRELVGKVKAEEGTLAYTLNRGQNDSGCFLFYEKYKDAEALLTHSSTGYFKEVFVALDPLLAEPPVIEMYEELASI